MFGEEQAIDLDQILFGNGESMRETRQQVEGLIAEVRRELFLRSACGGLDHLEREEELLDELTALEQDSRREPSLVEGNFIREVDRWN